jgi:hypothetical protein
VLKVAVKKRIAPAYLTVASVAYIAFYFKQHQPSGTKLVELPDWQLFFLPREGVERFLFEAHQRHLLEYHDAVDFPGKHFGRVRSCHRSKSGLNSLKTI